MAKQTSIDDKANTPVQGTEGAAAIVKIVEENQPAVVVIETPEWVQTILDSNAKVIESNEKVVDGLEAFKEHASDFVEQIIEKGSGVTSSDLPRSPKGEKEIDPDASYHVTAGNEFRDPNNFTIAYSEGDDVTHLGVDKLSRLLSQGLVSPLPKEED